MYWAPRASTAACLARFTVVLLVAYTTLLQGLLCLGTQMTTYKTYVKRESDNQSRLRHPLIVSIQEVSSQSALELITSCTAQRYQS